MLRDHGGEVGREETDHGVADSGHGAKGDDALRVEFLASGAREALVAVPAPPLVPVRRGELLPAAVAGAGCSAVLHVAADYRLWVAEPAPMYRANVEGSVAMEAPAK